VRTLALVRSLAYSLWWCHCFPVRHRHHPTTHTCEYLSLPLCYLLRVHQSSLSLSLSQSLSMFYWLVLSFPLANASMRWLAYPCITFPSLLPPLHQHHHQNMRQSLFTFVRYVGGSHYSMPTGNAIRGDVYARGRVDDDAVAVTLTTPATSGTYERAGGTGGSGRCGIENCTCGAGDAKMAYGELSGARGGSGGGRSGTCCASCCSCCRCRCACSSCTSGCGR